MKCDKCTTKVSYGESYAIIQVEEESSEIILCDKCLIIDGELPRIPVGAECYFFANDELIEQLESLND